MAVINFDCCRVLESENEMLVCSNWLGTGERLKWVYAFDEDGPLIIRSEPCPLCNEEKVCPDYASLPSISSKLPNQGRDAA